jgi:hypothetical protein
LFWIHLLAAWIGWMITCLPLCDGCGTMMVQMRALIDGDRQEYAFTSRCASVFFCTGTAHNQLHVHLDFPSNQAISFNLQRVVSTYQRQCAVKRNCLSLHHEHTDCFGLCCDTGNQNAPSEWGGVVAQAPLSCGRWCSCGWLSPFLINTQSMPVLQLTNACQA